MTDTAKLIEALHKISVAFDAFRKVTRGEMTGRELAAFGALDKTIDAALASITPSPVVTLCAPVAGRNYRTRDGRKVTGLSESGGMWSGIAENIKYRIFWGRDGSYNSVARPHALDLVAEWTDEAKA